MVNFCRDATEKRDDGDNVCVLEIHLKCCTQKNRTTFMIRFRPKYLTLQQPCRLFSMLIYLFMDVYWLCFDLYCCCGSRDQNITNKRP